MGAHDMHFTMRDLLQLYFAWQWWIWIAIFAGGQFLLLLLQRITR